MSFAAPTEKLKPAIGGAYTGPSFLISVLYFLINTPLKRGVNENELAANQTFVVGASGLPGGLGDPSRRYFARLRAKFSRRSRPFSMFAMLVA